MWQTVSLLLVVTIVNAEPGIFGEHFDASLFAPAPVLPALPAPTFFKAPIFASAPIVAPSPIIKTIAPAPIIKAVAPYPIVKAVAPATSYATVTQFQVTHPVVKTIIAPQPILKTIAIPAPIPIAHGFHGFH